jgi:hypothetical protein
MIPRPSHPQKPHPETHRVPGRSRFVFCRDNHTQMVPSRAQTHRSALENYAATYSRWVKGHSPTAKITSTSTHPTMLSP